MHPKVLLFSSFVLLCFAASFTQVQAKNGVPDTGAEDPEVEDPDVESPEVVDPVVTTTAAANPVGTTTTAANPVGTTTTLKSVTTTTAANPVGTTTTAKLVKTTTTKKYNKPPSYNYGPRKPYRGNNNNNYDGYYNDNYQTGTDGRDPSQYGTDYDDYGPTYDNKPSMLQSLDLWIGASDDWEQEGSGNYGRGRGNYNNNNNNKYNKGPSYNNNNNYNKKYNKGKKNDNKNYGNDDYNDGPRQKRSYSRVRFPVKQVKNYRQIPFRRMPPLISIFPWLPIFYDKLTYQTFIFSPAGGIYIIPPLINFYGQRFAVAQLIKWGYASLVSTGAPPPAGIDVAPLVQPPPPAGGPVVAGVVGSAAVAPAPTYDSKKVRFNGGVKTDFPTFKPRYSQTLDEGSDRNYGSGNKPQPNYGGTRNQEVYAQGGQRNNGGGGGGGGYNY